ncbi:hypothetical protein D3C84_364880 [compost metagenome]
MCRLRRPFRRWLRPEGTGEASGLAGEKTFGAFFEKSGSFQSHSPQPEGRAKPCRGPCPRVLHGASRAKIQSHLRTPLIPNPSPARGEGSKTISGTGPSPARGEGSKDDHGNRPLSRKGRRRQRLSRGQAPLLQGEKGAKTITGTDPSPARGEGSKNDHGSKPLSRMGRRRQRLSRG